jgi:hypothetical protein
MQDRKSSPRILVILAATAITLGGLAYHFVREEDAASDRQQSVMSKTDAASGSKVDDKLAKLADALERYRQISLEQQARLNERLADLDTRLRSLENTAHEAASDSAEQGKDTAGPDRGTGKPGPKKISDADIGHWMDETLRAGFFDREATELAREQAVKSIAKLPGLGLEDIQCGRDFCRATFTQENGEPPEIEGLFGEPPFETEGFAVNEADGRVALYFTRPGESLEALRGEAQQGAQ